MHESLGQLRDDSKSDLKDEHLLHILKLFMQNFFIFHGQPYEQIKDYITEIVLQKLEAAAFETQKPSFWVSCVDYTFEIIKSVMEADFKTHLN